MGLGMARRCEMNIQTEKVCAKSRGIEHWIAWDDDVSEETTGRGHSEQEAIDDLMEQVGEPFSMVAGNVL